MQLQNEQTNFDQTYSEPVIFNIKLATQLVLKSGATTESPCDGRGMWRRF